MALTKTQVSELYVAIFNRASEGEGNTFWQTNKDTAADTADAMLATQAAQDYFGTSLDTNQAFIEHIYENTLNKTYAEDTDGVDFWVSRLDSGDYTRGEVVSDLVAEVANYSDSTDTKTKAAYDQFTNRVDVSNYMADTVQEAPADYKTSTAFDGDLTVTSVSSTVDSAKSSVDDLAQAASIDGETFTLTKANDEEVFNGTEGSDLFDATELGSLQDDELLLDNSTSDADVLNAAVNNNNTAARIQNIETLNIEGEYVKTGLDLTDVSGANELNFSTKIAGGTATVTNAESLAATNINAGSNISTLDITSLTSGTRDEVKVDAGEATTLNLTGATAGSDSYNATVTDGATVTIESNATGGLNSAGDAVTLNAAGEIELDSAQGTAASAATMTQNLEMAINASDALDIELSQSAAADLVAKEITLGGSGDVTLKSTDGLDLAGTTNTGLTDAYYDGVGITNAGTGTSTVTIETLSTTGAAVNDFSKADVDVISLVGTTAAGAATGTTSMIMNENTTLNLAADVDGNDLMVMVDNGDKENAYTSGAAIMTVSEALDSAGSNIVTGTTVDTLIISAEADEASDYDADANGYDEITSMHVDNVTMSAVGTGGGGTSGAADTVTDVMVVKGDENITLDNVNVAAFGQAISAQNLTGDLTINTVTSVDNTGAQAGLDIGDSSKATVIVGGQGDDEITIGNTTNGMKVDVSSMAGDNEIDISGSGVAASEQAKVTTGAGSDEITSVAASSAAVATLIDTGAGDDTINTAAYDSVTTGEGSDTVVVSTSTDGVTVTDFTTGSDIVEIAGTAGAAVNFSNVTVKDGGLYVFGDTNDDTTIDASEWGVTLKNSGTALTATDMRDSAQANGVVLVDGSSNVLGDYDDTVSVAASDEATVTTGDGEDTVQVKAAAVTGDTSVTVSDFTVGEDTIVVSGTIATDTNVNLKNVTDTNGVYKIGTDGAGSTFKLKDGGTDIVTNNDLEEMVQLGVNATTTFEVTNSAAAGSDTTVTASGGVHDDFVTLTTAAATNATVYNFKDNGGVDTVIMTAAASATAAAEDAGFNLMTGIDTLTDPENTKVDLAASASKISDAKDGAVYVFADSLNGADAAKIDTFKVDANNGYTQEKIDEQVAAFLDAGLGVQDGETYIAVINNTSTDDYEGVAAGTNNEAYAYKIQGDADGVDADDITLVGILDDAAGADVTYSANDIA